LGFRLKNIKLVKYVMNKSNDPRSNDTL